MINLFIKNNQKSFLTPNLTIYFPTVYAKKSIVVRFMGVLTLLLVVLIFFYKDISIIFNFFSFNFRSFYLVLPILDSSINYLYLLPKFFINETFIMFFIELVLLVCLIEHIKSSLSHVKEVKSCDNVLLNSYFISNINDFKNLVKAIIINFFYNYLLKISPITLNSKHDLKGILKTSIINLYCTIIYLLKTSIIKTFYTIIYLLNK